MQAPWGQEPWVHGSPLKSAERGRATGPGAMGPGKPWARAGTGAFPARARARARVRARVRACRVPCYGVMPASFEILPPETLSGATDAADARPPVF